VLKLKDMMTRDVLSVTPDTTLRDAMQLLSERHVGGAPVVDRGKVVGIFSSTDILAFLADLNDPTSSLAFRPRSRRTAPLEDVTVDEVMTRKVESLRPECSVDEAAVLMVNKQIHRVLVTDGNSLLGIVTTSDVARTVAEHGVGSRTYVFAS
jgi:CBS domain-containing protein